MVNLWLMIGITIYLHGGDWNHGILWLSHYIGNGKIIPTDFHSIIFQRGSAKSHQPAKSFRNHELIDLPSLKYLEILFCIFSRMCFHGAVIMFLSSILQAFSVIPANPAICNIWIWYIMCVVSFCRMTHTNTLTLNWPPKKNDEHTLLFAGIIPISNHFHGYNLMVVMRKLRFDFDVSQNLSVITSSNLDHTPA